MSSFANAGSRITQPLYDTMQAAAAAGDVLTFFSVPMNGALTAAANKTYADTNLRNAAQLEKGVKMTVSGISFNVRDTASGGARVTLADYLVLYQTAYVRFLVSQTELLVLPLSAFPAGPHEVQYFSNITAAATEYKANHGLGSVNNVFPLGADPIKLDDQENFAVEVTVPGTIAAVTDLCCTLWGTMFRPVR